MRAAAAISALALALATGLASSLAPAATEEACDGGEAALSPAGASLRETAAALGMAVERARPARPDGALSVAPGEDLQARVDAAPEGSALALAPGEHRGPLRIARRVTVWGPPEAVVRSDGAGSTIKVEADGAALLGFTVDGSGGRFDLLDAAVHIGAADVRVEGVLIRNALFGILVEKSRRATVHGNVVIGSGAPSLGLRGDAIRLWETTDSLVIGNQVADARDVVVWYSSRNRVVGNIVTRCRYGTHLMYSHANEVRDNGYVEDTVGIFVMYSREALVRGNVVVRSRGAAGLGLGLKEAGSVTVVANRFLFDTVGAYVDGSPLSVDDRLVFEGNEFRLGDAGIVFHASPRATTLRGNIFRDNASSVRVEGGGDARAADWRENDWDDYAGYDLDGDGFGDIPYELRSFSGELVSRYPDVAFFRGTPVLALADAANKAVPLYRPKTLLVDPRPRMGAGRAPAACGGDRGR